MLKTSRRRLAALVHHHIALRVITRTITLFDKYHLVISYEWMRCGWVTPGFMVELLKLLEN